MLQGSAEEKEQAGLVLQEVLEAARIVAVMLSPIVPALARLIYLQLGYSDQQFEALTWQHAHWGGETCFGAAFLPDLLVLLFAALLAECCWRVCLLIWVVRRHCLCVVGPFACLFLWSDLPGCSSLLAHLIILFTAESLLFVAFRAILPLCTMSVCV